MIFQAKIFGSTSAWPVTNLAANSILKTQHAKLLLCWLFLLTACCLQAQIKLWGMTSKGGEFDAGTIINLNTDGSDFSTFSFYRNIGSEPKGDLLAASNGKFYGMTSNGGSSNDGVIFEYDPVADVYLAVHHFSYGTDGATPNGSLTELGGKFYGMTFEGGSYGDGVLFEFDPAGNVLTVLRHFDTDPDGGFSHCSLIESGGKLYGMNTSGGDNADGTLFEFNPVGNVFTVLKHFDRPTDGGRPRGSLLEWGGKFYGMASDGGSTDDGTLFEFNPAGNVFTVLKHFNGATDGERPFGSLIAVGGKFYGMANQHGSNGYGTLFEFNPSGNVFTVLKHLDYSTDGGLPFGSLIASGGKFYGMTSTGGSNGFGTLFEFNPSGNVFTVLKHFDDSTAGAEPYGSLIESGGKFYGMTNQGGSDDDGTLFEFNPVNNLFTVLKHLNGSPDGRRPQSSLLESGGKLYGTTASGGNNGYGTLFEHTPAGNVHTVLKHFNYFLDGAYPNGSLIESGGKLYGMANQGGSNDFGTLYEFNPGGNVFTVLKHLNAATDGAYPNGSLIASGGKLYGMTAGGGSSDAGTLFEFNPAGNGFTVLKHFGGVDGANPYGSLLESGGKFYGMTAFGGSNDDGTLFEWNPAGNVFTVLKHFGGVDGAHPTGSLIASGGKFYGMTPIDGSNNAGTLFELNPAGNVFTVLRHFDYSTDGAYPNGSLLESGGKFYGMTIVGGSNDEGTLFEFNPAGNGFTVLKHLNGTDGAKPQYGNLIAVGTVEAPDYTITTTGNAIVITDLAGNGETLDVSQNGSDIRFAVTPDTRTYSINGGAVTAFTTPANVALAGATSIEINTGIGNDIINIGAFTANLPSLTVNGGTGDDAVHFNDDITFAANADLDVDLQNDDAAPGTDRVVVATNANLVLSGTGAATLKMSRNMVVNSGGSIETVNGNLEVEANQQTIPITGIFQGVDLNGGVLKATGTGAATVKGKGGDSYGIYMHGTGAAINSHSGDLTVLGAGAPGTLNTGIGVYIDGTDAQIASLGSGNVQVTGIGGAGTLSQNIGVFLFNGTISAGGSGTVTVIGTGGGSGSSNSNYGVLVVGLVTSSGGDVFVTGTGGGSESSNSNHGVFVAIGTITAGGNGLVTVSGTGGLEASEGSNIGVFLRDNSLITSSGGNVSVTGQGGGTGAGTSNYGVSVISAGKIMAGGSGTVTVIGTGSLAATGALNGGIMVTETNSSITSSGGDVSVTGIEGAGPISLGIINQSSATITTAANGGNLTLIANSMSLTSAVSTNAGSSTTLRPHSNGVQINLGADSDVIGGPLSLSDSELDFITTGTLLIGDANSGTITVSADITRPAATNMQLVSNGDVTFSGGGINTGGGTLLLNPGTSPAAVKPAFNGTDAAASTVSFGSDLSIVINGDTPGNGTGSTYTQLTVAGAVNLTGVDLVLSGAHAPVAGQTFTIVDNDGAEAVTGTFAGLAEGATISNFLGSSLNAIISYLGGDGNDVTIVSSCPLITFTATPTGTCAGSSNGQIAITGESGGNSPYLYSIDNGMNYQPAASFFGLAANTYQVRIKDVNDCESAVQNVVVSSLSLPTASISGEPSFCQGGSTTLTAGGGGTYLWDDNSTDAERTVSVAGAYTVVVTNANGCTDTETVSVTNNSNTPPTAICQNVTVEIQANEQAVIAAGDIDNGSSDNCGLQSLVLNQTEFDCGHVGSVTVVLTATDVNGLTAACTANVTVTDPNSYCCAAPSALCKPATVVLDAAGQGAVTVAAINNGSTYECGLQTMSVNPTSVNCAQVGTVTVTLTVTDVNNDSSQCITTVTVQENTLPTITCPNPVTVTCSGNVPAVNLAAVTASDNCGAPVKSHLGDATSNQTCTNRKTVTRTYKAADASGNTKTCAQIITVYDDVKPNFSSVPANVTVQCNSMPPVGNATATDGCGGPVTVAYNGQTISNILCTDRYTITRQWTATDGCGNTKTATQRITVQDTQKPNFSSVPANVTVQCSGLPAVGTPVATDNCDTAVEIDYNGETRTNGSCPDTYVLTRKWTATDNCGNTRTATQRITVQDTQKPMFTAVPQNLTMQCSDPLPSPGNATATDNCDADVAVVYLGQSSGNATCANNYQLFRSWKATDNCGNSTVVTQTIVVQDTQAPTFTNVPNDVTIQCSNPVPPIGQATATDACNGYVQITFLGQTSTAGNCPQEYTITRSWRAQDECGNSVTASQVITVMDTQAPGFTNAPANVTIACGSALPGLPAVTAADNCDNAVPVTYLGETTTGPDCPYTVTRTWTVSDDCGNATTHTQIITVQGSNYEDGAESRTAVNRPPSTVHRPSSTVHRLSVYPNPAISEAWVAFHSESENEATVFVFDADGRLVQQQVFGAFAGSNRYRLDLFDLPAGMYSVRMVCGEQVGIKKLMVVRQ